MCTVELGKGLNIFNPCLPVCCVSAFWRVCCVSVHLKLWPYWSPQDRLCSLSSLQTQADERTTTNLRCVSPKNHGHVFKEINKKLCSQVYVWCFVFVGVHANEAVAACFFWMWDYAVSIPIWVCPAPEKQCEKASAYQQFGKQPPN